jgi:hypothetical protein
MKKNIFILFAVVGLFTACSTETFSKIGYDLVQKRAEDQCQREVGAERAACFSRINRKTYNEYEKERSTSY